jgi:transposase, IS30 family
MPKGYQQLTYSLRCQIYALKKSGFSNRKVAQQLGVDPRTIDRELARNSGKRGYRYKQAEQKCQQRRQHRKRKPVKLTPDLLAVITEKLTRYQWSPEQIAGWLKHTHGRQVISHERIYQVIWADKRSGGKLYTHLRRRARKYLKRIHGKTTRGQIKHRVGIEHRPPVVAERSRIGDWEADTIVGKAHKGAIVSLVERKTRYTKLVKVERATAKAVTTAITLALQAFKGKKVFTVTFDNGKEFAGHTQIAQALKAETYFAQPYHSWERGTNENTNGLVRQYFPKQTAFAKVTEAEVARVEFLLNHRPRKCLGYMTPAESIQQVA